MAPAPANNEPRINDKIRAREVRLVAPDGEQVGIKPLPEALAMARELDLDLVEVADKANPPVCRIMDYGKFKYEAAQRAKESRRNSSNVVVKEMKYRPKIGAGDFETKTRKVEHFLDEGHKVKVTIMFRGREMQHPELGRRILDNVADAVRHTGRVEVEARSEGRNMTMVLVPDRKAQAAAHKDGPGTSPEGDRSARRPAGATAAQNGDQPPAAGDGAAEAPTAAPATAAPTTEAPTSEAPTSEPTEEATAAADSSAADAT